MERSLLLFKESIKSKQSFETYLVRLKMFMKYHNIQSYDEIMRLHNLQELFEDWIIDMKLRILAETPQEKGKSFERLMTIF